MNQSDYEYDNPEVSAEVRRINWGLIGVLIALFTFWGLFGWAISHALRVR